MADSPPQTDPKTYPILCVHGLDDTGQVFKTLATNLTHQGWQVYCCDLQPSNGQLPLEALAQQLKQYIDNNLPNSPFNLLGFSMGGIISRYYLQRLEGIERVRRFISISSPHQGTWTGFLRWNVGCSQMRPNSPFLQDLNQDWQVLEQVNFVSLWTPLDLMIIPANSSVIPVGQSRSIPVPLHAWMIKDDRVFATLHQLFSTSAASTLG